MNKRLKQIIQILGLVVLLSAILSVSVFVFEGGLSHVPPSNKIPTVIHGAGATARCRDGYYSYSTSHIGTCAAHGGVESWL